MVPLIDFLMPADGRVNEKNYGVRVTAVAVLEVTCTFSVSYGDDGGEDESNWRDEKKK